MSVTEHRKKASDHSLGSSHQCIYNAALNFLKRDCAKYSSFIDFGAGRGDFVTLVQESGLFSSWTAVDLMPPPEDLAKGIQWSAQDLNHHLELPDQSFDCLTSLEVIEHLENPRHCLREIFRILKPGGRAIVSTPNNESYRSLLSYWVRGHFVAFTDSSYPAHITPLNRKDLERASLEAGFRVLGWEYTNFGVVPGWTRQSWQSLTVGLAKGLRFSDNFFVLLERPESPT